MKKGNWVVALLSALAVLGVTGLAGAKTPQWSRQFGTSGDDAVFGAASAAGGVGYTFGMSWGDLGEGAFGGADAFVRKYSGAGSVLWTRQFGTAANDVAFGGATDANGNVYVVGFAGASLPGESFFGEVDAFLRKYNSQGNEVWTVQFGTDATDQALGVDIDSNGNIYVAGMTEGGFADEGGFSNASVPVPGRVRIAHLNAGSDNFLVKFTPAGAVAWFKQFGVDNKVDRALDVAVAPNGTSYVTGGTGGDLAGPLNGAGTTDVFLAAYTSDGTSLWTRQFGTPGDDEGLGVVVDAKNRPVISGRVNGRIEGQAWAGMFDAFFRRYTIVGAVQLTKQFGTPGDDGAWDVATDASNNIYLTGLAGGPLAGKTALGLGDAFIRRYKVGGGNSWTIQTGSSANEFGLAIDVAPTGAVFAGGYTEGGSFAGQPAFGALDAWFVKVPKT
jgi:hypothetical protein